MKNQKGFSHLLLLFIIVIIISGVIGFSLGKKVLNTPPQSSENEAQKVNQGKLLDYEDKLSRLTKFENLIAYSPKGTQLFFKCYSIDNLPTDSRINKIKQELEAEKRLINTICSDPEGKSYVVDTYLLKDNSRKVEQRVDLDIFTEPDFFTSEFIYQPEIKDSEMKYFKLDKWFSNRELIFSLIQWPNGGPMAGNANSGLIMTYVKIQNEIDPKLIEFCNWGIAGGTSARYISSCTTFTQDKQSLYLLNKDLP